MKKTALFNLVFLLWIGIAHADTIPFIIINQSLVADRLMPVGTEVKIRVRRISDQFNAAINVECFPESIFTAGRPSDVGIVQKSWRAIDLHEGDVLRYTTKNRCFIGFSGGSYYSDLQATPLDSGYKQLTMEGRDHRWVIDVTFPDYDF